MKIFALTNGAILSSCQAVQKMHELIFQTIYGLKQLIDCYLWTISWILHNERFISRWHFSSFGNLFPLVTKSLTSYGISEIFLRLLIGSLLLCGRTHYPEAVNPRCSPVVFLRDINFTWKWWYVSYTSI